MGERDAIWWLWIVVGSWGERCRSDHIDTYIYIRAEDISGALPLGFMCRFTLVFVSFFWWLVLGWF